MVRASRPRSVGTFRAFANPSFRFLWPANFLAYTSRWMQMTLMAWLVLELTDSPLLVSLIGVFVWMPMLVLGLVGGLLADSINRRALLNTIQAVASVSTLAMTALLFTDYIEFWHAYVAVSVTGVGWALDTPSRNSVIHDLLGTDGVTNAVALDMMGMNGSRMVGPALAGLLIALVGVKGGYVAMPGQRDAWTATIGITWPKAPWARKGIDARVAEAAAGVGTARARHAAAASAIRLAVHQAYVRADAAREQAALLRTSIVPQSDQTLAVSRAAYQTDQGDFLTLIDNQRVLLDVQRAYYRALSDLEQARADLERAVGTDLLPDVTTGVVQAPKELAQR